MNNRNHIKTQKSFTFLKKNLKTNMLEIKNMAKLSTIVTIEFNIVVLCIVYVIQSAVYLRKFL